MPTRRRFLQAGVTLGAGLAGARMPGRGMPGEQVTNAQRREPCNVLLMDCPSLETLPPPTGLTATPISATEIRLEWTGNGVPKSKYRVVSGTELVSELDENSTMYTVGGLPPASGQCFQVQAFTDSLSSALSNPACAVTLAAPLMTSFRFAEAVVLFRRKPGPNAPVDASSPDTWRAAFGAAGVNLSSAYHPFQMRGLADAPPMMRPIRYLTRGDPEDPSRPVELLFQTVNLEHWTPDLERLNRADSHDPALNAAIDEVAVAVEGLTSSASSGSPLTIANWELVAASPNWLAAAAGFMGEGGPGGRPVPVSGGRGFRPRRNPEHVQRAVAQALGRLPSEVSALVSGSGTKVAVLDTWPMDDVDGLPPGATPSEDRSLGRIRGFISRSARSGQPNPRLENVAAGNVVNPARVYDYSSAEPRWGPPSLSPLPATHVNWQTGMYESPYDESDHGLFIADLIKDIAPEAELSVYRVLNNGGTGDLDQIVRAMEHAIGHADGVPLVINLSLVIGPPLPLLPDLLANPSRLEQQIAVDLLRQYARNDQAYASDPLLDVRLFEEVQQRLLAAKGTIDTMHYLFTLPATGRVLAVAAAGNDSGGPDIRFGPRLPAAVEGVLGVSAHRFDGTLTAYSNHDDNEALPTRDDGVAAYGGDVRPGRVSLTDPTSGVVGLAVTDELCIDGACALYGENTSGWVAWAGTSFATPIVAGLAACIWGERAAVGLRAQQLRTAIVHGGQVRGQVELKQSEDGF